MDASVQSKTRIGIIRERNALERGRGGAHRLSHKQLRTVEPYFYGAAARISGPKSTSRVYRDPLPPMLVYALIERDGCLAGTRSSGEK